MKATLPGYSTYHFEANLLNAHKPERLALFVADYCGIDECLGIKGKQGILKSIETRQHFLADSGKSVIFHYTPNMPHWINQIEIWDGNLAKQVIRRGNSLSKVVLRHKFNRTMAKPF